MDILSWWGPATGKGSGCARAAVGVLVCCMGQDQRSDQSFATQFTAKKGKFWTWTPLGMLAIALAVNTHSQHRADPRVWQRQCNQSGGLMSNVLSALCARAAVGALVCSAGQDQSFATHFAAQNRNLRPRVGDES